MILRAMANNLYNLLIWLFSRGKPRFAFEGMSTAREDILNWKMKYEIWNEEKNISKREHTLCYIEYYRDGWGELWVMAIEA